MNNIYLIGFMGTGKSTIARAIRTQCEERNLPYQKIVDTDDLIVQHMEMTIPEIFQKEGEERFRQIETEVLRDIAGQQELIVACGGGVAMKEENVAIMRESGSVVLLTATPETVLHRVAHDNNRPLLKGRKTVEQISQLMEQRMGRYEAASDLRVTTDFREAWDIADEILQRIH